MFWPQVLSRSGTDQQRQTFRELLNIKLAHQSNTDGFKGQNKDFVLLRGVPCGAMPEDVIAFFDNLKSSIKIIALSFTHSAPVMRCPDFVQQFVMTVALTTVVEEEEEEEVEVEV